MTGLVEALLWGATLSLVSGGLAWLAAGRLQRGLRGHETLLWRAARLAAIAPLLLAPLIWAVPEAALTAGPALHGDLAGSAWPQAAVRGSAGPVDASPAALPGLPDAAWLALALYLAGLTVSLGRAARRHFVRRKLLARTRAARPDELALLSEQAEELDGRAPEMRVLPGDGSPMLTGWRGVIVMPEALFDRPRPARHALTHELCHWQRGDEQDRLTGAALMSVLWFHWPLRRIERALDNAREMACDADSLAVLGADETKRYARTLIELMRHGAGAATAFGPPDRRHREMRIQALLAGRPVRRLSSTLLAGGVIAACLPVAIAQSELTERRVAPPPAMVQLVTDAAPAVAPAAPAVHAEAVAHVDVDVHADVEAHPAPVAEPVPAAAPHAVAHAAAVAVRAPVFSHPVAEGRISSRYGHRPARPAGAPVEHGGVDLAAPEGTPIAAPAGGVVTHAAMGYAGSDRWGNTLVIDHGDGWQTLYAHMEGFDVAPGDRVMAGQTVGRIGLTGATTGSHVHVELRHNGERRDPADFLVGLD